MKVSEPPDRLSNIRLAAPCNKDWNSMEGDERVRFCNACSKNVYNISDMSRKDAEEFLRENGVSKCMRIFRRTDGTIVNDNCPVGLRKIRDTFRWAAACVTWAISCCFAVTAAFAQSTQEALIKQLSAGSITDTTSKVILILQSQPQLPVVTGTVDLGGMVDFGKGMDMEEVLDKNADTKAGKAFRKKLLHSKKSKSFDTAANLHLLHNWNRAIFFYRKALKENPKDISTYNNLALCLVERKADGDFAEAADLLSRSEKLASESTVSKPKFIARKRPLTSGFEMVEVPDEDVVKNGNTLFARGRLCEERGALKSAVIYYNASLECQPTNLVLVKQLSELYVRMNKPDSARRLLVTALLTSRRAAPVFDETSKILLAALTNLDSKFGEPAFPTKAEIQKTMEEMQVIYNPSKLQEREAE